MDVAGVVARQDAWLVVRRRQLNSLRVCAKVTYRHQPAPNVGWEELALLIALVWLGVDGAAASPGVFQAGRQPQLRLP